MAKKKIDFGFTPSEYQEKIFDFVRHGNGNAVISALAGSGKTTTIVTCMKLIPKSQKCLFLAFNKGIVDTLSEKLKGNTNCYVRTMHSLGYLMVRRNLGNDVVIDEYKYRTFIKKNIADLSTIEDEHLTTSQVNEYVDSIIELTDLSRYNLAQSEREIENIALKYNVPVSYDEASVVRNVLDWGKTNYQTIDYTDMVWLPSELSLNPTGLQYDWIFFDEAQDASIAYIHLFMKCFKRGTRFIAVGDKKQSINGFAGSSPEAFDYLCEYPNTKIFDLPITYRCPVKVVELAKDYVKGIKARDNAPIGEVKYDCHISDLKDGDMVLARTKAPLLKLYTKLLKKGVECYIKGSGIGLNLIKMLENVEQTELAKELDKDGVFVRLYDNLFTERNKLMERYGLTKDDATLSSKIMDKYDKINSLAILAEKFKTKERLINNIKSIFSEENNGVMLSTIHKAKGLESNNVYILCRSSMPSRLAQSTWEKQQEENLIYVAITRPKQTLGFISEKELPPSGSSQDPFTILTELRMIEKSVCKVLGKEPMKEDDNIELTRMRIKTASQIDETSLELPQNTVEMKQTEENKPSEELLKMLSEYIGKGGDINNLSKFLS